MLETSGLMVTENNDGTVILEIVDYNVSEFGGSDYELKYALPSGEAEKLKEYLNGKHKGTLEEMLVVEFGKEFNLREFEKMCAENDIKYKRTSWRG
ncbi:MAG: hypothetical protein HFE35_07350 [Clostridia bacterium]|nr:hypothetical protein [Clostridia bacterium]